MGDTYEYTESYRVRLGDVLSNVCSKQTRVVDIMEADHINRGYFLCCSSRAVTYLPTDLNLQYGFLKRNEHLPADPESEAVFYSNMLEKYMERPTELENVLYMD